MKHQKSLLRQELRQRRRALNDRHQRHAAARVARALQQLPEFRRARNLAAYLSSDGEVSCRAVIEKTGLNRRCYLPRVEARQGQMRFYPFRRNQLTLDNRYQLKEPARQRRCAIDPRLLDIVLLPLVGFDRRGHRLGMGGGYYDRAFSFKRTRSRRKGGRRPLMIGLAHSIQEVDQLPSEPWDIPLDLILTERETLRLRRR